MRIEIREAAFDPAKELATFAPGPGMGAQVSFTGIVRGDDGLRAMEIEHYPGMTERAVTKIAREAQERFGLGDVMVLHRYGAMAPGEVIMMVATCAAHRRAAFEGADFLMDYLKSRAPFWKKEQRAEGEAWVAAKAADEDALSRW